MALKKVVISEAFMRQFPKSRSKRLRQRIYEETDSLVRSIEQNANTSRIKDFDSFKDVIDDFFGKDETGRSTAEDYITDDDYKFLFSRQKIVDILKKNTFDEQSAIIENNVIRERPDLKEKPLLLRREVERRFNSMTDADFNSIITELNKKISTLKITKKRATKIDFKPVKKITQKSKKGNDYKRTSPRRYPKQKNDARIRYLINNPDKDKFELQKEYEDIFDESRTAGALYYERRRLLIKENKWNPKNNRKNIKK